MNVLSNAEIVLLENISILTPDSLNVYDRAKGLDLLTRSALIPQGEFILESQDRGRSPKIRIESFESMVFPVTNLVFFDLFRISSPSHHVGSSNPLESINWLDCIIIANQYNVSRGLPPAYVLPELATLGMGECEDVNRFAKQVRILSKKSWRLPTEVEWEFMAGSFEVNSEAGWFSQNSDWKTHPVGQKNGNHYGLHEMLGNTWDWLWNWFSPYDKIGNLGFGPDDGDFKTGRGGCWYHTFEESLPNVSRIGKPASYCNSHGLRLIKTT